MAQLVDRSDGQAEREKTGVPRQMRPPRSNEPGIDVTNFLLSLSCCRPRQNGDNNGPANHRSPFLINKKEKKE